MTDTREIIKQSQFSLVGDFSPYENAHVFVLTHESLLNSAAQSEFGGYGAVIRVGVTATENGVQVSYVNPVYMTNLYHIPEVPDVAAELAKVFGEGETFGSKRGKSKRSLKNYQYMMFMPEFEVAIPGKGEVLIGVTIGEGEGADSVVMPIVDSGEFKHTAHLPYTVLVSDGRVYAQAGKFRIASAFPDLGMGTFMKISDAPDGIRDSLKQLTTK